MRVVEKKVEDRGKTVKNYKKKKLKNARTRSGRKEKLKSVVKEIVKSVKSVVKEIVKSVKSVVKVRSVEKACSGKNLKKRIEKSYPYIYFSLLSVIYHNSKIFNKV